MLYIFALIGMHNFEAKMEEDIKLIIFIDDDGKTKNKNAIITEKDEYGIEMELWDVNKNTPFDSPKFFIPWHRVLKIKSKEVKNV